ncbi:MAG: PhoU domain-containing protein [bacterium]
MAEKFHTELEKLKADTLEMAHLGRFMLRTAVDALIRQDAELAASVVARKEEIHRMEVRLEEHCYHLIALNQPMARDMRFIACTLKVITASLRLGRYGKVIANIVKEISDKPHIANLMSIPHMADLVMEMVDELTVLTGMHPFLLRNLGDILVEVRQMLPGGRDLGVAHLPLLRLRLAEHGRLLFETNWKRLQKTVADLLGVKWLKSRTRLYTADELG